MTEDNVFALLQKLYPILSAAYAKAAENQNLPAMQEIGKTLRCLTEQHTRALKRVWS